MVSLSRFWNFIMLFENTGFGASVGQIIAQFPQLIHNVGSMIAL
jgi:hypothetical protein